MSESLHHGLSLEADCPFSAPIVVCDTQLQGILIVQLLQGSIQQGNEFYPPALG